jgi:hypothetical protein
MRSLNRCARSVRLPLTEPRGNSGSWSRATLRNGQGKQVGTGGYQKMNREVNFRVLSYIRVI